MHNQTWELVSLPHNRRVVGCKWVLKVKRHVDDSVARYKGKLVVKGYLQEAVWLDLRQVDINNAFLNGDLNEEIYMLQPPGFEGHNGGTPTPMISSCLLSAHTGSPIANESEYRSIVGAFQYIVITRPDITFAVNRVYASWGNDLDDRCSTSGFCIFLGENPISWGSKKQHVVSCSTEAEYRSLVGHEAIIYWKFPFDFPKSNFLFTSNPAVHQYCPSIHIFLFLGATKNLVFLHSLANSDQCKVTITDGLVLELVRRNRSDWKLAYVFFQWVSKKSGNSLGFDVCNEILDILGRMHWFEELTEVFDKMSERGLIDERTFRILVNRYAAAHMVEDAIWVFNRRK
ncbi:Cysteine-rich RLK (RECEPTOR-like protein kinase) 8 [Gossypium australe]|uniref:Cysteine-rich RLK (RECEPTOR-like protein kinase) 8 n=1 Tax=Gossypium australe TaxID=47621 RepID=A0A5B6W8X9_9ROSI|nr:Cysteine-rich RLK (RECEPTOR-like protein kinase) 8 [Gossypium australe]